MIFVIKMSLWKRYGQAVHSLNRATKGCLKDFNRQTYSLLKPRLQTWGGQFKAVRGES